MRAYVAPPFYQEITVTPLQQREIDQFVQDRIMDTALSARERDIFRLIECRLVAARLAEADLEEIAQAQRVATSQLLTFGAHRFYVPSAIAGTVKVLLGNQNQDTP